jgi:hypothetical protein
VVALVTICSIGLILLKSKGSSLARAAIERERQAGALTDDKLGSIWIPYVTARQVHQGTLALPSITTNNTETKQSNNESPPPPLRRLGHAHPPRILHPNPPRLPLAFVASATGLYRTVHLHFLGEFQAKTPNGAIVRNPNGILHKCGIISLFGESNE